MIRRVISFYVFIFLNSNLLANPCTNELPKSFGHVRVDSIVGVYDGDTIRVRIDNWPPIIGEAIGVRINGIDTPEIRGKCPEEKALAREARAFTRDAVTAAKAVELRNLQCDKYFRLLADVCVDGQALSSLLISNNLAYPYEGGRKQSWCDRR
ncbi:thermonuclease family protein [Litorivivens sp.]|uniref:thermonuclease family protein n=1 Tax=Litorivivens sp. TaxID=2020868 RepID=UPI003563F587